jgi:hypothetical protein
VSIRLRLKTRRRHPGTYQQTTFWMGDIAVRISALTRGLCVPAIVASLVTGCGSGSGNSYGMTNPMPTVMFTQPAQASSINFGQAVQLAWSSNYATSCTASTSSSMGGSFSGSQSMSGTATVAPTGPGAVTYTLSCTGAGGTASATTSMVTVNASILSTLSATGIMTIGSTADPVEIANTPNANAMPAPNPYGLAIAPATAGLITKGDLIVCNFNNIGSATDPSAQGRGTTIVGLHPMAGETSYHIAQSSALLGCNAVSMLPDGSISASSYGANQVPLVSPSGVANTPFSSDTFADPWGQAYVAANGSTPAALYVSNADGSIDRIALSGDAQSSFAQIAAGFCGSGAPGAVFAPAGLTYDPSIDTLYVVDTSSNSVVAFANVSSVGAAGVIVDGQCGTTAAPATPPTPTPTFSGPSAASARVIAHGGPFIAPISAALLADGDLIVGNGDINIAAGQMPNLAVEVSPVLPGGFVGQPVQLDTSGTPGALFGIAATVDASGNQIVYFNDDNTNSVMVLTK